MANEPRHYYNIKGVFPEVVEDFNFNALPEPSSENSGELDGAADIKLDHLDEEDAISIIYELNRPKE